jgi:hypothetical protein
MFVPIPFSPDTLKCLALIAPYNKQMPNRFAVLDTAVGSSVMNPLHVAGRNSCAPVPVFQILQLHIEKCCLQLIKPGVYTHIVMHIFFLCAVISNGADTGCQFCRVCRNSARIAKGPQIFARIKAEASGITPRTGTLSLINSAVRLCRILQHIQVVLSAMARISFMEPSAHTDAPQ